MQTELLKTYAQPVPRYTSYPTAPHFDATIGPGDYERWLAAVPAGSAMSLYVHIPFCDTLCWYCGCHTKATRRYQPVAQYLDALGLEIDAVSRRLSARPRVTHLHWGGGSPNILSAADIRGLAAHLRRAFEFDAAAEFAVEVDPRDLGDDRIAAFAEAGVNRASVGVQDFDADVQRAINRRQSFEATAAAVRQCRDAGVDAINIDLVYGLPHQTRDSVAATIERVIEFAPDRIALFGYAHLPSRLPHQRRIDETRLPGPIERLAQASRAADRLSAAGYVRVGLDHFALAGDPLAGGPVRRNFQGYTTDTATTLIGLGASAIGRFDDGYVQNAVPTGDYRRRVGEQGLATVKGRALTMEDRARSLAIERLMCDLKFSAPELISRFGTVAYPLVEEAKSILAQDVDGLLAARGNDGSFAVTDTGRPFLRSICARFDAYLGRDGARHSAGV